MKGFWQKFGKSLLLPISTIAVAGIFLGLAAALQNKEIVGEAFVNLVIMQNFIGFIRKLAGLVFGNLPLFFCISIAVGLAKDEKPTAAFSAVLGFLVLHLTLSYILDLNKINAATMSIQALMDGGLSQLDATIMNAKYETVLGFFTLRMNVFGGILIGGIVTFLHNKFYTIQLPSAINFFGGKRFIPLITLITIPFVGLCSYYIWPYFDNFIGLLGQGIASVGDFGPFLYGSLNRLLIPTGLHHILNQIVRFTPVGGTAVIDGQTVMGALNIFNTAIASPTPVSNEIFQLGARYVGQGHTLIVLFGLPAASLAMYRLADQKNKKRIKALLIAGVVASVLTGVTEPLEFTFMFISPILFLFHVLMTGIGYFAASILGISVGGVQAGLIDFTIFGIFRGFESKWYLLIVIGIFMAIAYYFGFTYLTKKFNINTPGRNENLDVEDEEESIKLNLKDEDLAKSIIEYLGGKENIDSITNCFTRLRVTVKDDSLVNENKLKLTGASGISRPSANNVQVIYGLKVEGIARSVKEVFNRKD
ncbi:PTS transporter subunit EIIC [Anaerorhabdus sp.]|jgi:maltose/glucose PTS system EIICB component|uniref:PTS transporter subunit EIIC n=1 Tax=Anaerorhabdus sp. TaxID=1872524 RepID=UPI002FCA8105